MFLKKDLNVWPPLPSCHRPMKVVLKRQRVGLEDRAMSAPTPRV